MTKGPLRCLSYVSQDEIVMRKAVLNVESQLLLVQTVLCGKELAYIPYYLLDQFKNKNVQLLCM